MLAFLINWILWDTAIVQFSSNIEKYKDLWDPILEKFLEFQANSPYEFIAFDNFFGRWSGKYNIAKIIRNF